MEQILAYIDTLPDHQAEAEKADRQLIKKQEEAEKYNRLKTLSGAPAVLGGNRQLLYSIIYNLCDNAIKYNRESGSVFIDIRNEDAEIILSVKDTGIGIAPEHQERIFERFYRVDKSHSKAVGGTGLGLSIVKHAARIHNAQINVTSTLGEGTAITIHFPR